MSRRGVVPGRVGKWQAPHPAAVQETTQWEEFPGHDLTMTPAGAIDTCPGATVSGLAYGREVTEQQRYDVVCEHPSFELRRYPEHVVAEVEVDGTFESAGNKAFRPLVSYIGGRNDTGTGLAMTAPVVQRRDEPLPHDVETETTGIGKGRYIVAFVLPRDVTGHTVPTPSDEQVHVRVVPEEYAVVSRFSGRWTASSYRRKVVALEAESADAGYVAAGPARFARFDPPWTPWFMRRNEVAIPVEAP